MRTQPTQEAKTPFSIESLPKRPQTRISAKNKEVTLTSNMFRVKVNMATKIYSYHLDIHPEIQADNRKEKTRILELAKDLIKSKIGNFANSGQNLYGVSNPKFEGGVQEPADYKRGKGKISEHIWLKLKDQDVFLRIRLARVVKMQDLKNQKERFPIPLQFLDKLLGTMMRSINLTEVGKARAYVDPSSKVILNCGIALFSGYFASFNLYSEGLFLKVDSCTKITRTKTVLQRINQVYESNKGLSKQQKRSKLKEELMGQVVMAAYGNIKHWKIEEFVFDEDANRYTFMDMTMAEYYQQKYQLTITAPKQPFIRSYFSKRDPRPCLLLPQFLYLTGMPEGDQRIRRQVSSVTIKPPQQKLNIIKHLMNKLQNSNADLSLKALSDNLGLDIDIAPQKVQATILEHPKLILGCGKFVDQSRATSFTFRNLPIFDSNKEILLYIGYFSQTDYTTVQKSLKKLASDSCVNLQVQAYNFGNFKNRQSMEDVKDYMHQKSRLAKINTVIMVIIPNQMKPLYKQIKKLSLLQDSPILTQVVLEATFKKKGLDSILTKILLQITAKTGGSLWVPFSKQKTQKQVMMIGVHQTGKLGNRKKVVTGFSSTINQNFQQYYSKSYISEKSVLPIVDKMMEITTESLMAYVKNNKGIYPEEIIILRNGSTDNMDQLILQHEVEPIKHLLAMKNCLSKLTYISIDAKPSHKFFLDKNGTFENPHCGTVVNSKLNSPYYDFYLYPAICNMGSATPVRYKVVYSNSEIDPIHLQNMMYHQCFSYANWTGSIRFPACLQYAKKLSQFVSQQIDASLTSDNLNNSLYFI